MFQRWNHNVSTTFKYNHISTLMCDCCINRKLGSCYSVHLKLVLYKLLFITDRKKHCLCGVYEVKDIRLGRFSYPVRIFILYTRVAHFASFPVLNKVKVGGRGMPTACVWNEILYWVFCFVTRALIGLLDLSISLFTVNIF